MLNQKQENFQENASKKQDEIENFWRKKNEQIEGKKSAAEGGRIFFEPFFNQNRRKLDFFRVFAQKAGPNPKKSKKKAGSNPKNPKKKHKQTEIRILAILVKHLQKKNPRLS